MDELVGCASFCTCVRAIAETDEIEIEIERGGTGGRAEQAARMDKQGRASE